MSDNQVAQLLEELSVNKTALNMYFEKVEALTRENEALKAALRPFQCGCVLMCMATQGRKDRCVYGAAAAALPQKESKK